MDILNLPADVRSQLQIDLRRPSGAFQLFLKNDDLLDIPTGSRLMEEVAGRHVFKLVSEQQGMLSFYHASPGTGTRVARVNLARMRRTGGLTIYFHWSPDEICLSVGSRVEPEDVVEAKGEIAQTKLQVLADGTVLESALGVEPLMVAAAGVSIWQRTAIDAWMATLEAIRVLQTGEFETTRYGSVLGNMCIVVLVTGLEAYLRGRFVELEYEGVPLNEERLLSLVPKDLRKPLAVARLRAKAAESQSSLAEFLARNYLSFQKMQVARQAFNRAYAFQLLDVAPWKDAIPQIKRALTHRHRVIHVSALEGMLAPKLDAPPQVVTANFAGNFVTTLDHAVTAVHEATLKLGRTF